MWSVSCGPLSGLVSDQPLPHPRMKHMSPQGTAMSHDSRRRSLLAQLDAAAIALAKGPASKTIAEHYAELMAELAWLEGARTLAREIAESL